MRAAWGGRVGDVRLNPGVLPDVIKVEIVVQVVLKTQEGPKKKQPEELFYCYNILTPQRGNDQSM